MTVLVVGGTGKTGKLVIEELLKRNCNIKTIIRDSSSLSPNIESNTQLTKIVGTVLDMESKQLETILYDCDGVVSCLGHNITCQGLFGEPKRLVTNTVKKLFDTINKFPHRKKIKFVLMNSVGVKNLNLDEKNYFSQKCITYVLRKLLPAHLDNEQVVDYLRLKSSNIQWVSVRPVSLVNNNTVTKYDTSPSPIENPIFGSGEVSRVNVAHFISELISNEDTWNKWKEQMPVIYNKK